MGQWQWLLLACLVLRAAADTSPTSPTSDTSAEDAAADNATRTLARLLNYPGCVVRHGSTPLGAPAPLTLLLPPPPPRFPLPLSLLSPSRSVRLCGWERPQLSSVDLNQFARQGSDYDGRSLFLPDSDYDFQVNLCRELNYVGGKCVQGTAVCERFAGTGVTLCTYAASAPAVPRCSMAARLALTPGLLSIQMGR
jgi:hypothetical protein